MAEFDDLLGEETALVPQQARANLLEVFSDPKKFIKFVNAMRKVPLENIADCVINDGYAAVLWKFREAALSGDIIATRSLKIFLDWAEPHVRAPKKERADVIKNVNSAAFGPRGD